MGQTCDLRRSFGLLSIVSATIWTLLCKVVSMRFPGEGRNKVG